MRNGTKRGKKVEQLLYSTFRGNEATYHGSSKEDETRQMYETYQRQNGHPELTVTKCGLFVSLTNAWLAASPDGAVHDPSNTHDNNGLLEIKNPFSVWEKTLTEACANSSFCLEIKEDTYKLKVRHDYYFQIQCQPRGPTLAIILYEI